MDLCKPPGPGTFIKKKCKEGNTRQLDDTTDELARKHSGPERTVRNNGSKPVTKAWERKNGWVEHNEKLLIDQSPCTRRTPKQYTCRQNHANNRGNYQGHQTNRGQQNRRNRQHTSWGAQVRYGNQKMLYVPSYLTHTRLDPEVVH